jgi:hypothetical protein
MGWLILIEASVRSSPGGEVLTKDEARRIAANICQAAYQADNSSRFSPLLRTWAMTATIAAVTSITRTDNRIVARTRAMNRMTHDGIMARPWAVDRMVSNRIVA